MEDKYQKVTTQIYDIGAQDYKKSTQNFYFPGEMFEYFLEQLSGKKILDIGCAYGRDMLRMKKLGYDVEGIEISQELIKLADTSIKNSIIHDDMLNISKHFRLSSLDGIFSSASIVHMDQEIAIAFLEKSFQILNNKGVLFLSIKVGDTTQTLLKKSYSIDVVKKYTIYSPEDISNMLKNIGFKILKTHIKHIDDNSWMILICKK